MKPQRELFDMVAHTRHPLHQNSSLWSNTNCYLDLWLEILPALGMDPAPAMVCAVSARFIGDQWEFLKVNSTEIEDLYGIEVGEYATWRPLLEHVQPQLAAGNICLVEVDAYFLPDTRSTTYQASHEKTTIAPVRIDADAKVLEYFHNEGMFSLSGPDFEGVFGLSPQGMVPSPYVELARLGRSTVRSPSALQSIAVALLRRRMANAPAGNPVGDLNRYIVSQIDELKQRGWEHYHQFCFATTRQLGISAMLAAEFCTWLNSVDDPTEDHTTAAAGPSPLVDAAALFLQVSATAKSLQFKLARAVQGEDVELSAQMSGMQEQWQGGQDLMAAWLARRA